MFPKILRSKKGLKFVTVLIGAITLVVVMIVLIVALYKIKTNTEDVSMDQRCKASMISYITMQNSKAGWFAGDAETRQSQIDCPVRYITIPKKTSKNKQRQMISERMVRCWNIFGADQVRLFSAKDNKFCIMCAMIQFEDKEGSLDGLPFYMLTEPAGIKIDNSYPVIFEYITGRRPSPKDLDNMRSKGTFTLDKSKRYVVAFTYFQTSWASRNWKWLMPIGIAGTVAGNPLHLMVAIQGAMATGDSTPISAIDIPGLTPDPNWQSHILLMEYSAEKIKTMGCHELPISQMEKKFRQVD